jgi:hypothetical protein
MYIHHNTSVRDILEDDSISSASKARIYFCLGKGVWIWLVGRPSIHLFCIAHFTFTSTMHFHVSLVQPLAFILLMCESGHKLNEFDTHLTHCPFGGQQIATHHAIKDVMYALVRKSGHVGKNNGTPLHQKFHYELIST